MRVNGSVFHEYFYKQFSEIDEEQRRLISAIRTKTGLVVLCDQLRETEIKKQALLRVYLDLRPFFG